MENGVMKIARPMIDFLLGVRFRLDIGEDIAPRPMKSAIMKNLSSMESNLQKIPEMRAKTRTIKYILTGFADEVILYSGWNHSKQWQSGLLEMELFGTGVAGESFFSLIEKEGYGDPDLAELFYSCLVLGFRGKYRGNDRALKTIRDRLYAVLRYRLPEDERMLSPGAERVVRGRETRLPRMFGLWALGVVFFVSLGLYLVISQWIYKDVGKVISEISGSLPL